jgi:putative membrane protein
MRVAVLALPLVYLVVARDITLGSYAFKKRSTDVSAVGKIRARRTLEDIKKSNTLTTLEILQYFKEFEGKRIKTEGMVYKGEDVPDQYFLVFRFLMICCAADSLPAGALVEHEDVDKFENDSWVRVEGILGLKPLGDFILPYIKADNIVIVDAPMFPYLFPSLL